MNSRYFRRPGYFSAPAPRALSFFLPLLALPLLALTGCDSKQANGGAPAFPPAHVNVADVVVRDVPIYLDEIGKAVAYESVAIQPQVSGKVLQIHFTDGAELKKSQPLFTIDPRPFQAAVNQALANVAQAKANLEFARLDFSRVKEAMTGNAVSKQEFDQKKSTVEVDEAQVESAEAAVDTAKLNLEYTNIQSPIDGRAGIHLVDVGNVVNANSTNLLVIQRLEPIYVDFTIPENSLEDVRKAMSVSGPLKLEVTVPNDTSAPHDGEVTVLDNTVQDSTGTVRLRGTVPNHDRVLWPGQFVNVRLILSRKPNALLVPSQAVQISQKGPFVYVVRKTSKDGQTQTIADLRPVQPGQRQGDLLVVNEGVKPGEQVVVTGQLTLFPGAPVQVVPDESAAPAGAAQSQPAPATQSARGTGGSPTVFAEDTGGPPVPRGSAVQPAAKEEQRQ